MGRRLMQVVLYNGRTTVVVHTDRQTVSSDTKDVRHYINIMKNNIKAKRDYKEYILRKE